MGRFREATRLRRNGTDEAKSALRGSDRDLLRTFKDTRRRLEGNGRSVWVKAGFAGGIAVVPAGIATMAEAISAHGFNVFTQNISSQLDGSHGALITLGMAASGAMVAGFAYAANRSLPRKSAIGEFAEYALGFTGTALLFTGIFHPGEFGPVHYFWATGYFGAALLSQAVISGDMILKGPKALGTVGAVTTAVGATAVAVGLVHNSHVPAIYEFIASTSTGTWMLVTSSYGLAEGRLMPASEKKKPESQE